MADPVHDVVTTSNLAEPAPGDLVVFLERHSCGHYAVLRSTPPLAAGLHGLAAVRVSTTDARCLVCTWPVDKSSEEHQSRLRLLARHPS